jgi:hypothetical protein
MLAKKYFAKKDTWFKEGTEVKLVSDCGWAGGVFQGTRVAQDKYECARHGEGTEYEDEELCPYDEFYEEPQK